MVGKRAKNDIKYKEQSFKLVFHLATSAFLAAWRFLSNEK
jgi:hypothetical protein